jgi:hypothetical protein
MSQPSKVNINKNGISSVGGSAFTLYLQNTACIAFGMRWFEPLGAEATTGYPIKQNYQNIPTATTTRLRKHTITIGRCSVIAGAEQPDKQTINSTVHKAKFKINTMQTRL